MRLERACIVNECGGKSSVRHWVSAPPPQKGGIGAAAKPFLDIFLSPPSVFFLAFAHFFRHQTLCRRKSSPHPRPRLPTRRINTADVVRISGEKAGGSYRRSYDIWKKGRASFRRRYDIWAKVGTPPYRRRYDIGGCLSGAPADLS